MERPTWTPPMLKTLIELRLEKFMSYRNIAVEMGVPLGSICSAIRLHFTKDMKAASARIGKPPVANKKQGFVLPDPTKRKDVQPRMCMEALERLEAVKPTSIRYPDPRFLSDGYCRAIQGEPSGLCCCGQRTESGQVYCKEHRKRYHVPAKTEDQYRLERLARVLR